MIVKTDDWLAKKREKFDAKNKNNKKISSSELNKIRTHVDNLIIKHRDYTLQNIEKSRMAKVERDTIVHFFLTYEERPINNVGLKERNAARNLKVITDNSSGYAITNAHDYNINLGKFKSPRFPYNLSNCHLITNDNFKKINEGDSLSSVINLLGNEFTMLDENRIRESISAGSNPDGKTVYSCAARNMIESYENYNRDVEVYVWVASVDGHDNVSSLNTEGNGRIKAVAISVVSRNGIVIAKAERDLHKNKG